MRIQFDINMKNAKKKLIEYLATYRVSTARTPETRVILEAVDYALLCFYSAEKKYEDLKKHILDKDGNFCHLQRCANILVPPESANKLDKAKRNWQLHIHLAFLHWSKAEYEKSMEILKEYAFSRYQQLFLELAKESARIPLSSTL